LLRTFTVLLPEFVLSRWWEQLLHNQSALLLKGRLLFRPNTVMTSVPFHVAERQAEGLTTTDFNKRRLPAAGRSGEEPEERNRVPSNP
jgi:hypothetical protein